MTRRCCCTCSGSARRRIRSQRKATGVGVDLSMEDGLRHAVPVRGTALHPPALPRVDRLSRHPGRVHARARDRLLREQPARHASCSSSTRSAIPAAMRDTGSSAGGSPRATDRASSRARLMESSGGSSTTAPAVPDGPDDGTIAPWAVVASLPFAPEIVLPTIAHFNRLRLADLHPYGFKATFNPTFLVGGDSPTAGCRRGTTASTRGRSS